MQQDRVHETGSGIFAAAESRWTGWFRTEIGVRADVYTFNVNSDNTASSGMRHTGMVSPKSSFVFTLPHQAELHMSGGYAFHSNDARGTTITVDPVNGDAASQVSPLVRSTGGDSGLRVSPLREVRSTVSVWALDIDSELLFIGDGGATEPVRPAHDAE